MSYAANLTPDAETGLGNWKDGEIIASIYGARRGGGRVLPPMPTQHYAQGIAEGDLRAIIAYLRVAPADPEQGTRARASEEAVSPARPGPLRRGPGRVRAA